MLGSSLERIVNWLSEISLKFLQDLTAVMIRFLANKDGHVAKIVDDTRSEVAKTAARSSLARINHDSIIAPLNSSYVI